MGAAHHLFVFLPELRLLWWQLHQAQQAVEVDHAISQGPCGHFLGPRTHAEAALGSDSTPALFESRLMLVTVIAVGKRERGAVYERARKRTWLELAS